jgi:hypothetical protein
MPYNYEWQSRIKQVEREYLALRQACDRFLDTARDNPNVLRDNLRHREIMFASENLEGTYLIRLFAEFETGARHYWKTNWGTDPKSVDLLEGLAARCKIPDEERTNAQLVRVYRNSLVHEREEEIPVVPIAEARHSLCLFFSFLPHQW